MNRTVIESDKLQYAVNLVHALAHPLRLRIVQYLDDAGTCPVNKIYNGIYIEQSVCSNHLRTLRMAGVVNFTRKGLYVYYSLNYEVLKRVERSLNSFISA